MNNQNIANFLKQLRKTAKLSAIDVAEKLRQSNIEISSKTLYGYESGLSMPNADVFVALCKIYNCDNPMDIFPTPSFKTEEISLINRYRILDDYGKETVNIVLEREAIRVRELQKKTTSTEFAQELGIPSRIIQYFRSVSAGTGQVIFDDVYSERITIPDIPEHHRVAYAVKVSGHSMDPLYQDGDMLLIEPTCSIDTGEIGIFNVDGQAYVKKLGKRELISLNTEYGNIELTDDSRCMGRVVDTFTND